MRTSRPSSQVLPYWSGASSSSQASTSASAWFPPRLAQHTRQCSRPTQQSSFSTQPSTPQPASRLNTWKGPKGQPPPQRPVDAAAAEPAGPVTSFFSHKEALQAIPLIPKTLGFAGTFSNSSKHTQLQRRPCAQLATRQAHDTGAPGARKPPPRLVMPSHAIAVCFRRCPPIHVPISSDV